MLNSKVREFGRINGGKTLTKVSSNLIFRGSKAILPKVEPILIDEGCGPTQRLRSTTVGIGDRKKTLGWDFE